MSWTWSTCGRGGVARFGGLSLVVAWADDGSVYAYWRWGANEYEPQWWEA